MRDLQHATGLGQVRIHPRIGFQHIGQAQLKLGGNGFQRLAIIGHRVFLILTDQTAIGWR